MLPLLTTLTGLSAGALHVVSGPDHLAALAPLALDDRNRAIRAGLSWGAGHGLGVVAVGLVAVALGQVVAAEWISAWSEFFVGFLLLGVGAWALYASRRITVHTHGHEHEAESDAAAEHDHVHVHVGQGEHSKRAHRGHGHAALGVGMLHGAAGTGHVLGVVPALALPPLWAVLYLACYFIGAVVAMAGFAAGLGFIARRGGPRLIRGLVVASGVVAILVGLWWLFAPAGHA